MGDRNGSDSEVTILIGFVKMNSMSEAHLGHVEMPIISHHAFDITIISASGALRASGHCASSNVANV
jgi:hypothetical protein